MISLAARRRTVTQLTTKVTNEVVQLHLAFRLDVDIMQVRVEHDDGECDQENSVCRLKPRHYVGIAATVATSKCLQANSVKTLTEIHPLTSCFIDAPSP